MARRCWRWCELDTMARGKKTVDPSLICEVDIMSFRPQLASMATGAPGVLSIMQIARLQEGLLEQYRSRIPFKKRSKIEHAIRKMVEDALAISSFSAGERMSLLRMHEKGMIELDNANCHLAEIDFVEMHYKKVAAKQAIVIFDVISASLGRAGNGRPPRQFFDSSEGDWQIIFKAIENIPNGCTDENLMFREIRKVVSEAVRNGDLDQRGSTPKESIDTHDKRLKSAVRRMSGSSSD
jgi:hypothetical protein